MTHDEIRKLLGGYATNTLTETERRALMEAAVDDQELFNALQDEEALRELLADPASREQVYQALQQKPAARWRGGWVWGGALAAAVAAALVIAVVVPRKAARPQQLQVTANQQPANEVAPQQAPVAVAPAPKQKKALAKARAPVPAPAPAAAPAPVAEAAPRPAVVGGVAGSLGALSAARDAAVAPPLRYTVFRRNTDGTFAPVPPGEKLKAGDAVRLRITPGTSGDLRVDRVSESGETTSVLPALAVETGMSYEVPEGAIELSGSDRSLRIVLQSNTGAQPSTVDIPVGAN